MNFFNKLLIPIMLLAAFFAFNEFDKPNKNIFVIIIAIFILFFGMMKLSAKTPSKNSENRDENV